MGGAFQKLLARIDRGRIPLPVDAPTDFPPQSDTNEDSKYLPLQHPWEMPWPRGFEKEDIGPVWTRKDCMDSTLSPIAKGGESLALQRLHKCVSARPDWTASYDKPKTSYTETSTPSTTVLSPYLSVGCLSPRMVWHAVADAIKRASPKTNRSTPPVSLHGQLL